jgi:hypothetical protein
MGWYGAGIVATLLLIITLYVIWHYRRTRPQKRTITAEIEHLLAHVATLPLRTPQDYAQAYGILAHAIKLWLEHTMPHHENTVVPYTTYTDAECIVALEQAVSANTLSQPFVDLCVIILSAHRTAQFAGIIPASPAEVAVQHAQLREHIQAQHVAAQASKKK